MSKRRKARPSKQASRGLDPGDRIIRARTAELLWAVAHAARAMLWAPEQEDGGATAFAVLDEAIDALDAHVRSGRA